MSEAARLWERPLQRLRDLSRRKLDPVVESGRRPRVVFEDGEVRAVGSDGALHAIPYDEFEGVVTPRWLDSGGALLPRGVRMLLPARNGQIIVHETWPQNHRLRWCGRAVTVNLPFVITFAVFDLDPLGRFGTTSLNEVYFRNQPLLGLDDELLFPAFRNTSCHTERCASSQICLGSLARLRFAGDQRREWVKALRVVIDALFHAEFNLDMDRPDGRHSWFTETVRRGIDPRIQSIESWEAATRDADAAGENDFATTVPWIPTGRTVGQCAQRIAKRLGNGPRQLTDPIERLRRLVVHFSRQREEASS